MLLNHEEIKVETEMLETTRPLTEDLTRVLKPHCTKAMLQVLSDTGLFVDIAEAMQKAKRLNGYSQALGNTD